MGESQKFANRGLLMLVSQFLLIHVFDIVVSNFVLTFCIIVGEAIEVSIMVSSINIVESMALSIQK